MQDKGPRLAAGRVAELMCFMTISLYLLIDFRRWNKIPFEVSIKPSELCSWHSARLRCVLYWIICHYKHSFRAPETKATQSKKSSFFSILCYHVDCVRLRSSIFVAITKYDAHPCHNTSPNKCTTLLTYHIFFEALSVSVLKPDIKSKLHHAHSQLPRISYLNV